MPRKRITAYEKARIQAAIREWAGKRTASQIAAAVSATQHQVEYQAAKMGISLMPVKNHQLHDFILKNHRAFTKNEIAKKFNVKPAVVGMFAWRRKLKLKSARENGSRENGTELFDVFTCNNWIV